MNEFALGMFILTCFLVWLMGRVETVYKMYTELLHEEHAWLVGHVDLLTNNYESIRDEKDLFKRYEALPKMRSMYLKFWVTKEALEKSVKPIREYYL